MERRTPAGCRPRTCSPAATIRPSAVARDSRHRRAQRPRTRRPTLRRTTIEARPGHQPASATPPLFGGCRKNVRRYRSAASRRRDVRPSTGAIALGVYLEGRMANTVQAIVLDAPGPPDAPTIREL